MQECFPDHEEGTLSSEDQIRSKKGAVIDTLRASYFVFTPVIFDLELSKHHQSNMRPERLSGKIGFDFASTVQAISNMPCKHENHMPWVCFFCPQHPHINVSKLDIFGASELHFRHDNYEI